MKQVLRNNIFETNSSSTHALCICSKEEFDKWESGEYLYDRYDKKMVKKEEADPKRTRAYCTMEQFFDEEDEDTTYFEEHYTTRGGENIVVFGEYSEF